MDEGGFGRPFVGYKLRSLRGVILGLVPKICCPVDHRHMLGTSPSMTKEVPSREGGKGCCAV
jgi:hypothetical protein